MPVRRRRLSRAVFLALPLVLVLATNVAAAPPSWTSAVLIRNASDLTLGDADFAGHNVAIAWDEPGSPRRAGYAFSDDNGASFTSPPFFDASRQPAIDLCDGWEPNAVAAHREGPGNWVIEHTLFDSFDFSITDTVAPSSGLQHDPDIACAGGRLFVSWLEEEGSGDRLYVAHALRSDLIWSSPINLGFDGDTEFGHSLAVAGTDTMAYAAFARSAGDLRLMRWSIGPGPGYAVTPLGSAIIASGTTSDPADEVVIAAAGAKVAVAWFRCNSVRARVSNDNGVTWGPTRTLIETASCDGDFFAVQRSIAIRGNRIAVPWAGAGFFGGEVSLVRTTNDFATFTDDTIANNFQYEHLVGYLTVAGNTKLAAAFQPDANRIRFRRQN